ncbi:MAG TPA: SUMF1/EgtB/PvdO family nonheme iron enzyme [Candidatus Cloacimonetes bacterium]|nr:SUMF1/EgtB/PvdO family nonheme iron enzyme [Candidatus Cloacimonadota bacterium]
MQLQAGTILRDYKIEKLLGKGGMGTVYLAKDSFLERHVAIKELNPILAADADLIARFRNEAKLQAKLIHANIAVLYNFFEQDGRYYIVMEYAEGRTLKEIIRQIGPIPETKAISILKQVVNALEYAHSMGIVHRDIKPSNIILDDDDKVKILDFGIARVMGEKGLTQTGQQLGTVVYMSPEQVQAEKDIDGKTDVYSLGVTLFEMLSGHIPYDVNTQSDFVVMTKIVNDPLPDPRDYYPHISDNAVSLLSEMTDKNREKRISIEQITLFLGNVISSSSKQKVVKQEIIKPVKKADMILVEGGSFQVSSGIRKLFGRSVQINVSSFYICKYQVTQKEWQEVMSSKPSYFIGDNLPVEQVSWYDAMEYCNKRSIKEGLTPCYSDSGDGITCNWDADGYRLPTEAEWEYAARGGNKSKGYEYAGSNMLGNVAWYADNSNLRTHPVAQKTPNELGIYDMSGNVWEWRWDWYDSSCYSKSPKRDPRDAASRKHKVIRGGSWFNFLGNYCRVAYRNYFTPTLRINYIGFRVSRAIN